MDSGHNENSTSYKPSEPKPCANNCGFFGTAGKRNLCSKCYRDSCLQQQRGVAVKTLIHAGGASTSSSSSPASLPSNRCGSCNKKVGLTGFVCKCGTTFCGLHRYPEKHNCCYDFKGEARDAISKANPVVKADKIQRF